MRDARNEFFVGYRPTPPRTRHFLCRAAIVVVLIALGAAALIAGRQRDPGDGVWDLANQDEFVGRMTTSPYPMLELPDRAGLLVLVNMGKVAADAAEKLDGRAVRVRGTMLLRSNLRLLEVDGEFEPADATISSTDEALATSPVTLHGEIIDPKCFAGAMKPGDGKTHKACAALCLRGGIPPAFRTTAADGADVIYLLVAADGGRIAGEQLERVIARVGDANTKITGVIATRGDVRFLRLTTKP